MYIASCKRTWITSEIMCNSKHVRITSFCNLADKISDFIPSSENAFPRAFPSEAPRSFTAFPKSDSDCPNSAWTFWIMNRSCQKSGQIKRAHNCKTERTIDTEDNNKNQTKILIQSYLCASSQDGMHAFELQPSGFQAQRCNVSFFHTQDLILLLASLSQGQHRWL